jgi:hypothetical protein
MVLDALRQYPQKSPNWIEIPYATMAEYDCCGLNWRDKEEVIEARFIKGGTGPVVALFSLYETVTGKMPNMQAHECFQWMTRRFGKCSQVMHIALPVVNRWNNLPGVQKQNILRFALYLMWKNVEASWCDNLVTYIMSLVADGDTTYVGCTFLKVIHQLMVDKMKVPADVANIAWPYFLTLKLWYGVQNAHDPWKVKFERLTAAVEVVLEKMLKVHLAHQFHIAKCPLSEISNSGAKELKLSQCTPPAKRDAGVWYTLMEGKIKDVCTVQLPIADRVQRVINLQKFYAEIRTVYEQYTLKQEWVQKLNALEHILEDMLSAGNMNTHVQNMNTHVKNANTWHERQVHRLTADFECQNLHRLTADFEWDGVPQHYKDKQAVLDEVTAVGGWSKMLCSISYTTDFSHVSWMKLNGKDRVEYFTQKTVEFMESRNSHIARQIKTDQLGPMTEQHTRFAKEQAKQNMQTQTHALVSKRKVCVAPPGKPQPKHSRAGRSKQQPRVKNNAVHSTGSATADKGASSAHVPADTIVLTQADVAFIRDCEGASRHCAMEMPKERISSHTKRQVSRNFKAQCVACNHEDRDYSKEPPVGEHPFLNKLKKPPRDNTGHLKKNPPPRKEGEVFIKQTMRYCVTCKVALCTMPCASEEEAHWSCWAWYHRWVANMVRQGRRDEVEAVKDTDVRKPNMKQK